MRTVKALTTVLLCLAASTVCAQSLPQPAPTSSGMRMEKMPQPRPAKAGLALTFTDDADSVMLPAFAMRTTPMPLRFVRLGVQWRF